MYGDGPGADASPEFSGLDGFGLGFLLIDSGLEFSDLGLQVSPFEAQNVLLHTQFGQGHREVFFT